MRVPKHLNAPASFETGICDISCQGIHDPNSFVVLHKI